jgi:hypothetical protein
MKLNKHKRMSELNGASVFLALVLLSTAQVRLYADESVAETPLDPTNSWAFDASTDAFTDDALLDLRGLNEEKAGMHGFVRRSDDGMSFVRGDGEPLRFWAVVGRVDQDLRSLNDEKIDELYRFLAKKGVNMFRLFSQISSHKDGASITDVNEQQIDIIFRHVAAARRNGIYLTISPFWSHISIPASWGIEGYDGNRSPYGLLFIDPLMQEGYKVWMRELLTRPNPYTDTNAPLKDEPAVAIIQMHNEDCIFWHQWKRLGEPQQDMLAEKFGAWLLERYGSLESAMEAWDGYSEPSDDFENTTVGMVGGHEGSIWEMTRPQTGGRAARLRDQVEFLAELQRSVYADLDRYFKEELGIRQLTSGGNWKTADDDRLGDLQRWTYTATDIIAKNNYAGTIHSGSNSGYRIDPGHHIVSRSVLHNPLSLPVNVRQPVGHPFIIPETSWVNPNLYQAEGPFLIAAYQAVGGVDAVYWLGPNAPGWERDPRRTWWRVEPGDSGYALTKWSVSTPMLVGMFPANAMMYRMGYIKQGEPSVQYERTLDDLYHRRPSAINEGSGFDPTVDIPGVPDGEPGESRISRFAYLIGPVHVKFDGDPENTNITDLSKYIDEDAQRVRANTGEVEIRYGDGIAIVDTPAAQGVAGFLKDGGGRFELGDVAIESQNEYAVIQLVSMDGLPLSESKKVLLQTGTVSRLSGWRTVPAEFKERNGNVRQGNRIELTGKPPWRVANTEATITIANPSLRRATLLNPNGYADRELPVTRDGQGLSVELPSDSMYIILHTD